MSNPFINTFKYREYITTYLERKARESRAEYFLKKTSVKKMTGIEAAIQVGARTIEYTQIVTDYDDQVIRAAYRMTGRVQIVDLDGEVIWTSPAMTAAIREAYDESVDRTIAEYLDAQMKRYGAAYL